MAVLTVHDRQVDPTFQAAAPGGDSFANDGATELLIMNTGPTARIVTATAVRKCSHGFLDHWQKTVDAGELMRFGPFRAGQFNSSTGVVSVTYDDATDLMVAAQRQQ